MSFSDHKITAFTHRIADLPDQPNLPADELKERFDSSPEELRTAHNAVCDDADRLEARVEGIVVETFGDTIEKEMLSNELAAELDAKAEAADLTAEQTARANADSALSTRVTTLETELPQKLEIYYATYNGSSSGTSRTINFPFAPTAVLIFPNGDSKARMVTQTYGAIGDDGYNCATLNGSQLTVGLELAISCTKPHQLIALR